MGLGDAMIGLGIGLQGQAKLDMNAPMQLLQKRMAAKRAEDKYLQDIMDDTGKELRKLGEAGYHSKYIPVVKEKIAAGPASRAAMLGRINIPAPIIVPVPIINASLNPRSLASSCSCDVLIFFTL